MKIEHIALYIKDLEAMKDFYCRYFQAASNGGYYESCIADPEGNLVEITV